MAEFKLSAEEIKKNWGTLMGLIQKTFKDNPERVEKLTNLYTDMKETIMFSPASSYKHLHNAFPGGYVDHVIRVMKFSMKNYKMYIELGMDVSDFTHQELLFSALNHDLGKIGFPGDGKEGYLPEKEVWWKENRGRMYTVNPDVPFALVPDKSLYLLQRYGIQCSWNEYLGIRIHDGPYDSANDPYYKNFKSEASLRSNLPLILHQADMNASRFEWERWVKHSDSINTNRIDDPVSSNGSNDEPKTSENSEKNKPEDLGKFSDVFKE